MLTKPKGFLNLALIEMHNFKVWWDINQSKTAQADLVPLNQNTTAFLWALVPYPFIWNFRSTLLEKLIGPYLVKKLAASYSHTTHPLTYVNPVPFNILPSTSSSSRWFFLQFSPLKPPTLFSFPPSVLHDKKRYSCTKKTLNWHTVLRSNHFTYWCQWLNGNLEWKWDAYMCNTFSTNQHI